MTYPGKGLLLGVDANRLPCMLPGVAGDPRLPVIAPDGVRATVAGLRVRAARFHGRRGSVSAASG